jgi:hypothetical protein
MDAIPPEMLARIPKEGLRFSPVGMALETAMVLIKAAGWPVRTVRQGKITYFVTQDFNPERINLEANEEGLVESFYKG